MRYLVLALLTALLALAGCGGSGVGEPCELTSGTLGFGFDDPCRTKCLELEDVVCPDGSNVRQAVCAGREGCEPGGCPSGQACYSFEDPFEEEFFCIPADICGLAPASHDERLAWEIASRERWNELRESFADRRRRREGAPGSATSPAVELEPKSVAPSAIPTATPTGAHGSVLVEAWGADLALVACVERGMVQTGAACARYLPPGAELALGSWRRRTTGAKTLECGASSKQVPGVGTEQLEIVEGADERWGWVPAPPSTWREAGLAPLDPPLEAVARSVLPEADRGAVLELAAVADLDGDPHQERIVRALYPPADREKPGRSSLWLVDDDSLARLPTEGMDLNGVQDVRGIVPLDSGGALLVFTTRWMGGSGVHVIGPGPDGLRPLAEAVCGS